MTETARARLTGVEALRGGAATAVVLSHTARHVDKAFGAPGLIVAFQAGHAGVDLFFVISGFIILFVHRSDVGRPARLPHYLGRRFNRVFPLFWIALGLSLLMSFAGGQGLPELGRLFTTTFLLPVSGEPLLGIAWTLQFEIVFYAVFTVLILQRAVGLVVLAAWLALIVASTAGLVPDGLSAPLCNVYGVEFFLGMAAAYLLQRGTVPAPKVLAAAGLVLFVSALVAESAGFLDGFGPMGRLAYGLPAAMLVAGVAASEQAGQLSIARWLQTLGGASYSVYLFQFIFIGIVWQVLVRTHLDQLLSNLILFVLLAGVAVAGGVVVSMAVEKPLLRVLRDRRGGIVPQRA